MSKPTIIPNWGYQKPTKGGHRGLKKLLKYVSYRESPDHRPVDPHIRWTDCGLGDSWQTVYANASRFAGKYVLAHHLVISPAPDRMELIEENMREAVVQEVTERTIELWHIQRGLDVPEYAYCLHDRDTADGQGRQQLHTHIFVAGTIDNGVGERLSHRVNREQVCTDRGGLEREDNLHHIAREQFEQILERVIGLDWEAERALAEHHPDAANPSITSSQGRSWEISQ